jgi:hypothetical protein
MTILMGTGSGPYFRFDFSISSGGLSVPCRGTNPLGRNVRPGSVGPEPNGRRCLDVRSGQLDYTIVQVLK